MDGAPAPSNVVSLQHYTERLFAEHRREHELIETATRLSMSTLNERMQGINEFRGQLRDQAGTFATRDMFTALVDRIGRIENARARADGQIAVFVGMASLVSAAFTTVVVRLVFG